MNYYNYIIVGPHAAGKTTALTSLSELSFASIQNKIAEHQALSISLTLPDIEHAICKLEGNQTAFLHGYSNQEQITQILPVLGHEADGGIILLDHTQINAIDDFEIYLNLLGEHVDNLILAISHVDENTQQLLKKYRNILAMKNIKMPIFVVDPRKKEDIVMLIEVLLARTEVTKAINYT